MVWFIAVLASLVAGKKIEGSLPFAEGEMWKPIGRFCFIDSGGAFYLNITSDLDSQEVLFYHDMPETGFEKIWSTEMSCQKKRDLASTKIAMSSIGQDANYQVKVAGVIPRWWWVVFANCEVNPRGFEGLQVPEYSIEFLNPGGKFRAQFSYTDYGVYEFSICSLIVLLAIIPITAFMSYRFYKQPDKIIASWSLRHLCMIEFFHLFAICLLLAHLDTFSSDGVGLPIVEHIYLFMSCFCQAWLIYLFVSIGKGAYIDHNEYVSGSKQRSTFELLAAYVIVVTILLSYEYTVYDDLIEVYVYNTDVGTALCVFRVLYALYFVGCLVRTFCDQTDDRAHKSMYYISIGVMGTLWILSLPLLVFISSQLDEWNQKRVLFPTEEFFQLMTYIGFLFWFWLVGQNFTQLPADDKHATLGQPYYVDNEEAV